MLDEMDPDGSLKKLMADFSDPTKLSDPAFLKNMQENLLGNKVGRHLPCGDILGLH